MDRRTIATLGPSGTCSDVVIHQNLERFSRDAEVVLYPSYEEAIAAVENGLACAAMIAAAYPGLNKIIFKIPRTVTILECFTAETPAIVVAGRSAADAHYERLACFAAVVPLAQSRYPDSFLVAAGSNAAAAEMVMRGEVDAAVTTAPAAELCKLAELHSFGTVTMAWLVFGRYPVRAG